MISDIILALILLWALYFTGRKVLRFYKQAKSGKPVACSCAGCTKNCAYRK